MQPPRPALNLLPQQQGIRFDEPSHRYWVWSSRRCRWMQPPSCSQVLGISGAKGFDPQYWRRKLILKDGLRPHEAELYMELHCNGRAEIGTELHALIRQELLGIAAPPVRFAESLLLLAAWRQQFLPQIEQVIACEQAMASRQLFFTGTPDLIAKVAGRWLTVDWKTKADAAWPLQLAGYEQLAEENYGIQLEGACNVMVWPGGIGEVFYPADEITTLKQRYIGHAAWCHVVLAVQGNDDNCGALRHLLTLHPAALDWADPPKGHGAWTVAQVIGTDHPSLS